MSVPLPLPRSPLPRGHASSPHLRRGSALRTLRQPSNRPASSLLVSLHASSGELRHIHHSAWELP
eukprot:5629034-Prymnesium_polylepis.1